MLSKPAALPSWLCLIDNKSSRFPVEQVRIPITQLPGGVGKGQRWCVEEKRSVLGSRPSDQPVFGPLWEDFCMIAFVIHVAPAVVQNGFEQITVAQRPESYIRASRSPVLVTAGKPCRSVRVWQELGIVQTLRLLGSERAIRIGWQGC